MWAWPSTWAHRELPAFQRHPRPGRSAKRNWKWARGVAGLIYTFAPASGWALQAKKFYYNYLIPFYITQASLAGGRLHQRALPDISVGDAWHLRYEAQGGGFGGGGAQSGGGGAAGRDGRGRSAGPERNVCHRSAGHARPHAGLQRGTFIRLDWRRARPYRCLIMATGRGTFRPCASWWILFLAVLFGGVLPGRKLIEWPPLSLVGPLFDSLRKGWKNLSKPVKRQGWPTWRLSPRPRVHASRNSKGAGKTHEPCLAKQASRQ